MKKFFTLLSLCSVLLIFGLGFAQTPDYLVWVHPDVAPGTASAASGDSLFEALVANGQSAFLTDSLFEFGTNLSMYQGVFVVLGIFANNGILADGSAEALALDAYLSGGGSLYLEGGDCFYYDPLFSGGYDINPWFDCVPLGDGSADVFNLIGLNELSAFSFAYGGENNWMDELSSGGLSSEIWQETTTLSIHGLYYDGYGGVAMGVVPSFGGMISTTSMVSSQNRPYDRPANQQPELGSYKTPQERVANNEPFRKRYGYKPELAARIDHSKPLYKIMPNGSIEFLANNQTDLMAAYVALMNPAPELMYYKFNEVGMNFTENFAAAGSPVPDTASVNGGLTMGGTGFEGAALIGSGGSSTTDYVDTGWPTSLSGSWTISFWVNDMPSNTSLFYLWGDNTAASFRCFIGGAAGAGNLLARGPIPDVVITGVAPGPSEVVLVYDDATLELRAYVNGVLNNTVAVPAPVVISGTANFTIGGYDGSAGMPAASLMDEFKMYTRAVDVTPNSRDYSVPEFVDLPPFWYVGFPTNVQGLVVNEGGNDQTDVPVRFFVNGVQEGSDVLVSLASGDSAVVSFPWTPATAGMTNIKIQSFLNGDQDSSNDSVATDVDVVSGVPAMTVSPASVEDSLAAGPTSSDTITIGNVAGAGPLDFEITIEGAAAANAKVDFIAANSKARKAPIIARGKEIPVAEYLMRAYAAPKAVSVKSQHPEDLVEPFDQIMPSKASYGLKRISGIGPDGPDGEEVFGNNSNVFGPAGLRGRGNMFHCTSSTTLTEHRLYLNMTANSDMQFLVYECPTVAGTYNLINVSEIASSGTGEGWYSSGSISVPLVAGMYYMIYPQWTQPANYYNQQAISPYPIPASFGELIAGIGWTIAPAYAVPPPATQSGVGYVADPVAYYQTIVTGAGTSWLSVNPETGSIPAGSSMDVEVTFDANGILGGDYYANIIVNGNDPANLADTVAAHLYVIAEGNIGFNPEPVVFDTTFVGETSDVFGHVRNNGAGQLTVTNITSSNPDFSVNQTSFVVPPLDSVELVVSFSPSSEGSKTGTLTITSDDPSNPTYDVSVEGEALRPPQIGVNPSSITDSVALGDSIDVIIQISNEALAGAAVLKWDASVSLTTAKRLHIPAASPNFPRGANPPSMGSAPRDGHGILPPPEPSMNMTLAPGSGWGIEQANGFVTYFDLILPQVLYNVAPDPTDVDFDNAGDFGPGDQSFFYNLGGGTSGQLMKIDTTTGTGTALGNILPSGAETWAGMATDPTDGTIYAAGLQINVGSTLYIIDPVNLTATPVGPIGALGIISLAVDGNGDMWAHDLVTDMFLSIDKTTGAATNVGSLGFDANYGQGMTWDPATDQLYMAAFNNVTFVPELRIVDRATGGSTLVGVLGQSVPGGLCQLGFLAIPGAGGASFIELLPPTSGSVDPQDVANLTARIYGLDVGDTVYYANIEIESNDPANPLVTIPVEIRSGPTGITEVNAMPTTFAISQNYPNPFNPTTTFKYQLPEVSDVKLIIYNILGQKVRTLINRSVEPGYHTIEWNGLNDTGNQVATGLYISRFQAGKYVKTMKMMMLK